ncbi:MAG: hypothetical protein WCJ29_04140 [bacterium]
MKPISTRIIIALIAVCFLLTLASLFSCTWVTSDDYCIAMPTFNATDSFAYLKYLREGGNGTIAFFDRSTTEPQSIGIVNLFWAGTGFAGKMLSLSPISTYTALKILTPLLIMAVIYWTAGFFEVEKRKRLIILLLGFAFCGSHILMTIFGDSLTRMIGLNTTGVFFPFPIASQIPHLGVAGVLATLSLLLFYRWSISKHARDIVLSGITGTFLLQFQPYLFLLLVLVVIFWMLMTRKNHNFGDAISTSLLLMSFCVPVGYLGLIIILDPFTAERYKANITQTGSLWVDLLGFILPLILVSIAYKRTKENPLGKFILLWFALAFILAHLDFIPTNIRFYQGIGIPFSVMAVLGILQIWDYLKTKHSNLRGLFIAAAWILFYAPLGVFVFVNIGIKPSYVMPKDILEISAELQKEPRGIFLAPSVEAYLLYADTDQMPYVAHWGETLYAEQKNIFRNDFYSGKFNDRGIISVLQEKNINYVVMPIASKADRTGLEKTFSTKNFEFYHVPKR